MLKTFSSEGILACLTLTRTPTRMPISRECVWVCVSAYWCVCVREREVCVISKVVPNDSLAYLSLSWAFFNGKRNMANTDTDSDTDADADTDDTDTDTTRTRSDPTFDFFSVIFCLLVRGEKPRWCHVTRLTETMLVWISVSEWEKYKLTSVVDIIKMISVLGCAFWKKLLFFSSTSHTAHLFLCLPHR